MGGPSRGSELGAAELGDRLETESGASIWSDDRVTAKGLDLTSVRFALYGPARLRKQRREFASR